jgi:hypothetical protein
MTVIDWPKGLLPLRAQIRKHQQILRTGVVLAIDPSSASKSSMPGFALFENSQLMLKGTVKIDPNKNVYVRMAELYVKIQELVACPPDVLVIENINKMQGHQYLIWAVGVSISAVRAPVVIELHNAVWKSLAKKTPGYIKSDANDAELIGRSTIMLAQEEYNKHVDTESLSIGTDT